MKGGGSSKPHRPKPTPTTTSSSTHPPLHHSLSALIDLDGTPSSNDTDLFSFLSAMHLSGGSGAHPGQPAIAANSRKRKILDQIGGGALFSGGAGKITGTRPPALRGNEDDEPPLHTPHCSQSGFADEEDRQHHYAEPLGPPSARAPPAHQKNSQGMVPPNFLDIDENLAANFDDSLSGLGVDINTSNYSMSEALNALPNLSISVNSSHMFKQEASSPVHSYLKNEPLSATGSSSNFGALDLSNEEAVMPDGPETESDDREPKKKTSFAGSVSRENSRGGTPHHQAAGKSNTQDDSVLKEGETPKNGSPYDYGANMGGSHPNLSLIGCGSTVNGNSEPSKIERKTSNPTISDSSAAPSKTHKVILPLQQGNEDVKVGSYDRLNQLVPGGVDASNRFQYILAASTSIATKINEPTITYLNQGQAYELRLKKLGDLSAYRKKSLHCRMRICFHERRLQYMEAEQITAWSRAHPGERILDIDVPLSYGIIDPTPDSQQLNACSFKWDPTRDTGVFIKVNCISTEFTPKKHGGEKGVPFRLQVETYDGSGNGASRIHAAGCILQVFKLKGADRKHKQDREKISKRPLAEQEKYSSSYDCTVLSDLSVEHIYVPPSAPATSRPNTPPPATPMPQPSSNHSMEVQARDEDSPNATPQPGPPKLDQTTLERGRPLPVNAPVEQVQLWLRVNRYGAFAETFANYTGRDILRLMRDEIIALCGIGDGIRLYNDLHMATIAPRTTFYVAQRCSQDYNALFLEEYSVKELVHKLAHSIGAGLSPSVFNKVYIMGPHGILIRVTDSVIQYTKPETVFQFHLRQTESADSCDVILENVTPLLQHGHEVQENNGGFTETEPTPADRAAASHASPSTNSNDS